MTKKEIYKRMDRIDELIEDLEDEIGAIRGQIEDLEDEGMELEEKLRSYDEEAEDRLYDEFEERRKGQANTIEGGRR